MIRASEISTIFNKTWLIRLTSLLIFSMFFSANTSKAQTLTDSLFHELNSWAQIDTVKFNKNKERLMSTLNFTDKDRSGLIELEGNKYHFHGDDFTAKKKYSEANRLAIKYQNKSVELSTRIKNTWLDLGIGLIKIDEAIQNAHKSFADAVAMKDTNYMLMSLNALASYHEDIGKKDEAFEYFFEALRISENPKYYLQRATILNNLGLRKSDLGMKKEALKDFKEGLKLIENKKEYRIQTRLINNIAYTYNSDSTTRDSAYYYFHKTLEVGKLINEPSLFIVAYTNLAVSYNLNNNTDKCLAYYDSALAVIGKFDMVGMRGKIHLGIADSYRRQNKYPKALKEINKGFEYVNSEKYNKLEDLISYESFYSQIQELMGKHKESLIHYKQFNVYRDSMRELNNQKFLAELNLKYEDEKKQAEIEKQKSRADLAEQKQEIIQTESTLNIVRNSFIFIAVILIIVIFFSIFVYRSINAKKKMEQEFASNLISEIEDERHRISSDLHDHIGLNLILVKNELNKNDSNKKVVENVTNIVEDVRKISRNIYPSQLNKLGIQKSLESMFDKIEQSTGIICSYELDALDGLHFKKGEELMFYRIVQELSNNSIKHSNSKSIRLTAELSHKKINLVYRDNGIGFDKSKIMEKSIGMGLKNIINRVEKLGGTITFDTKKNQGLKVNIDFERHKAS